MSTVLCFGDSNTHGTMPMRHLGDRRRYDAAARWPGVMAAALGPGWQVIEEGHPGRTTVHSDPIEGAHKDGLAALPVLLESHRPLDLVLIMLGTNDLKARFSVPAVDIALGVDRLAATVAASECGPDGRAPALMLVAPVPIVETGFLAGMFAGGAAKAAALAGELAPLAAARGARFFDAGTVAAVDPVDGVHLSPAGHAALGAALAAEVRQAV